MKFIEWFIRLVRQDMKNYEEYIYYSKAKDGEGTRR